MLHAVLASPLKIPHLVIVKAPGLLPMQYTVRELSEELHIPDSTLRDWFLHGAPYSRDEYNHLWVNGQQFAAWIERQRKARKRQASRSLKAGEGFCLHCNQIILISDPIVQPFKGKLYHIKGKCPRCGGTINRGGRYGRTAELPQG